MKASEVKVGDEIMLRDGVTIVQVTRIEVKTRIAATDMNGVVTGIANEWEIFWEWEGKTRRMIYSATDQIEVL